MNVLDNLTGRELDAAVAVEVMGLMAGEPEQDLPYGDGDGWIVWGANDRLTLSEAKNLPHYSTDIAAAWEVQAPLAQKSLVMSLRRSTIRDGRRWWCLFAEVPRDQPKGRPEWGLVTVVDKENGCHGFTAAEAICHAALAAVRSST